MRKHKLPYYDTTMHSPDHDSEGIFRTFISEEVDAVELTVSVDEMVQLLEDQNKLHHLMRIPEVREAMFYYRLSGEFDA